MAVFAAFLRGINVGGNNIVPMAKLRETLANAGFGNVRTLLQSGNVLLSTSKDAADVERAVQEVIETSFGLRVEALARSHSALEAVIAANPLSEEALEDPSHVLVHFLRTPAKPEKVKSLQEAIAGPELARYAAGEVYFYYPLGIGMSKLTPKLVEAHLGKGGTARNWNTLRKLLALMTDST